MPRRFYLILSFLIPSLSRDEGRTAFEQRRYMRLPWPDRLHPDEACGGRPAPSQTSRTIPSKAGSTPSGSSSQSVR
jgi:hypothetical protein